MITFKSQNVDGEIRNWKFNSAKELEDEWNSAKCDVPANDDPIWDVEINGKAALKEATLERIGTDPVWFEDLITYFGIDIWG